jgi:hypothetical protein
MVINSVNFNEEWAQTVKEEVFIEHFLPSVWQGMPEPERKEKLSSAYRLMTDKPDVAGQTETTGQPEETKHPETPKRAKAKAKPSETNEGAE